MRMTTTSLWFLLSLVILSLEGSTGQDCTVTIQNGVIIGSTRDTLNPFKKVCSYMGVPYAAPPVASLRFKPPQPAQPWGDPINATISQNWCPQVHPPDVKISEDCLYLNVFQPKLENISNANLPVMIWLHGGAFITAQSLPVLKPTKLLARGNVILVVVQYRLGLLGLLSTGDQLLPGNNALKDQAFAIRWVSENIRAFGGNPGQVTVAGESSGASSAIYQMLSPLNKGLINGVIAQSGVELKTVDPNPLSSAQAMARRLNCPATPTQAMIDCLSGIAWEEIIQKQIEYIVEGNINMTNSYETMTPVVEPDLPGAFIAEEPINILKQGELDTTIPVMLGTTKHEGSYSLAHLYLNRIGPLKLDQDPEYMRDQLVPDILKYYGVHGDEANRGVASSVELTYLSGVNRSSWNESMPGLVDIVSVFSFKSVVLQTAELLSGRGSQVYLYSFEHNSLNSVFNWFYDLTDVPVEHGITHADDLIYLFDIAANFTRDDTRMSEVLCDMFINFANTGNPTPIPSEGYEQWPTYNLQDDLYMKLNITPTIKSGFRSTWRPNGFQWD